MATKSKRDLRRLGAKWAKNGGWSELGGWSGLVLVVRRGLSRGVPHYYSLFSLAFALASFLGMALVLFASVIVFRALKNKGTIVLMIGGMVGVFGPVCWFLFRILGMRLFSGEIYGSVRIVMQGVGSFGWLLVGAGMLMLAPVIAGLVRRNRELERIASGSE